MELLWTLASLCMRHSLTQWTNIPHASACLELCSLVFQQTTFSCILQPMFWLANLYGQLSVLTHTKPDLDKLPAWMFSQIDFT